MGRRADAVPFHRMAAEAHRALGEPWHAALALDGLARAVRDDDPEVARRHWMEAVSLLADYADPRATTVRSGLEGRLAAPGESG